MTPPREEPSTWLTLVLLGLHGPLGSLTVLDTTLFGEVKSRVAQHCGWHPHEVKLVQKVTPLETVYGQRDATPLWELLDKNSGNFVTLTAIRHRFCSRGGPDAIHRYVAGLAAGIFTVSNQAPPRAVCHSWIETLQLLDVLINAALNATTSNRMVLVDELCELCTFLVRVNDSVTEETSGDLLEEDGRDDIHKEEECRVIFFTSGALRKQVIQICEGIFDNMLLAATLGPSPNCVDMMELLAFFFVQRFMSMRILETMVDDLLTFASETLLEEVQKQAGGFCRILDKVKEARYKERVAKLKTSLCHPRCGDMMSNTPLGT